VKPVKCGVYKEGGHTNFAKSMKVVNLFIYLEAFFTMKISTSAMLFPASPAHKTHFNKINSAGIAGLHLQIPCRFV